MNPFLFTTRDAWGRPVRRFDHTAFAIVLLAAGLGTLLLWACSSGVFTTSAKLTARLVQSF